MGPDPCQVALSLSNYRLIDFSVLPLSCLLASSLHITEQYGSSLQHASFQILVRGKEDQNFSTS